MPRSLLRNVPHCSTRLIICGKRSCKRSVKMKTMFNRCEGWACVAGPSLLLASSYVVRAAVQLVDCLSRHKAPSTVFRIENAFTSCTTSGLRLG